jgi:hypothetical protein
MMDTEKEFERLLRDRALLMVLIGKVRSQLTKLSKPLMCKLLLHLMPILHW